MMSTDGEVRREAPSSRRYRRTSTAWWRSRYSDRREREFTDLGGRYVADRDELLGERCLARPKRSRADRRRCAAGNGAGFLVLEDVMSAGHTVAITPSDAHVEVRLDGELLATTDHALRLDETGLPSRYYLPQADVRMDLLRPTSFHTTCPFKGEASYWSANVGGQTHDGIVWAYEAPISAAAEIAGFLSFYPSRTEITVDGEVLAT